MTEHTFLFFSINIYYSLYSYTYIYNDYAVILICVRYVAPMKDHIYYLYMISMSNVLSLAQWGQEPTRCKDKPSG